MASDDVPPGAFDPRRYWEERLEERFGLHGVGHVALGPWFNHWTYRVRAQTFRRTLAPFMSEVGDGEVIDVGSGTGFYVDQWVSLGVQSITASDLTQVAVTHLRRRHPATEVRRLDITVPLPDSLRGRFAAASAMDVLFHIIDDDAYRQAFENLSALLRPGGILVFSEEFGNTARRRQPHLITRTVDETERALEAAKLRPVLRRPVFFLMNPPRDGGRRLHRRWWRWLARWVGERHRRGALVGPPLYLVDTSLARVVREGPSTEIMVCRS